MAFEFKLTTDEIREKMFDFIKPVYKNIWDTENGYINWIYGVYDCQSGFFITYINLQGYNTKYILITENGDVFYIIANRYRHTVSEIPDEFMQYRVIIETGIKLYNNEKEKNCFKSSFSEEQEKCMKEISENMKDRCRPAIVINSYEDAEKLFYQDDFNYYHISHMYNKDTIAKFDKYMPDEKMRSIRGKEYRKIISKISEYGNVLDAEEYTQISKDFQEAACLIVRGIDDIYENMTFEIIKNAHLCGVISTGYVGFVKEYIENCMKLFPEKVQSIRPILDFINENLRGENYKRIEFGRRELEKLIYKKIEGFQFVLTTDELREKIFHFLKPVYRTKYDTDVMNINWTTGVYDKESGIFLTRTYYVSDGVARCGVNYHSYIVITDSGSVFEVDNNDEWEKKRYDFRIPKQYEILTEKVKEGIEFYGYDYEYRKNLSEDTEKKLEEIKEIMDDRCHQNFEINCEEDAKNLFVCVNYNVYTIRDTYNRKTVQNFDKYASDDKILLWRGERYRQLLTEISSGVGTERERCQIFCRACHLFRCGVHDAYDKDFLNVVKYMYGVRIMKTHEETDLASYINTYVENYPDRIGNLVPLIAFIETATERQGLLDAVEKVRNKLCSNNT